MRLKGRGVELSASVRYVGRYANDLVDPAVAIASWTTMDVAVGASLDGVLPGVFAGSLVQLTVRNLFNREPPYAWNPLVPVGYDPVNASAMGRVVGVRVVVRW
jgi:outer membrane receptor protein involved in Fe transport